MDEPEVSLDRSTALRPGRGLMNPNDDLTIVRVDQLLGSRQELIEVLDPLDNRPGGSPPGP